MLIVTNVASFPRSWTAADGTTGSTVFAQSAREFLGFRKDPRAVFVVNCDAHLVLELAVRQLPHFAARRPLIAVDMILRKPDTIAARVGAFAKRVVLKKVDYFIHFFKDLRGVGSFYGIRPENSGFVDFKANLWNWRADGGRPEGDYVLCYGRSLRDFDTFLDAVEGLDCPAAIVDPRSAGVWEHGSRFTRPLSRLPRNVRFLDHDHTNESQADLLRNARIVVVPLLDGRLVSAGSTVLNAMALGKAVIATAGPGVSDLFDRELVSVPPEDSRALADAIKKLWSDTNFRRTTAQAGWEYAERCGSQEDFNARVIDAVAKWNSTRQSA
jgi:glycosyltransferase involved in cell wall biosynthesis